MAVTNAMFIFEVVVESVQSFVDSRVLIIRSDFADIFSLELKDPKQMNIVIPEPPPLPPEPPGKGKKKAAPKPKGKKGKVEEPPPEPVIQSGQSVLFTSTAEFLIQSMNKFPMEVSLWSKEDSMVFIGNTSIPWDPIFITYLNRIANADVPEPITLKDEYNIFEEGMAKIMAKLQLQVKLSFLGDKVTTAFRTLSEDPSVKKVLYTGINSKTTSYMCTMKTTDEDFEENCNKIENNFVVDKPKVVPKIAFADYKNAPGANLTFFNEGDYCCMGHADKPPESIYKAPEKCPDIDFIIDYVRKIIVSCNDNMRMLTPRPTIHPRVKATDIDKLCYCKETEWPEGEFAELFKKEAQSQPCPECINAGKRPEGRGATFDIANIRGPCGKPDCRIARDLRAYIEKLVNEDNTEFDLNELVGPCGSKVCTLAHKIQEFLRHEGVFSEGSNLEGLSTQCACIQKMQNALKRKTSSCQSLCSKDCDQTSSSSEKERCDGKACPFSTKTKVYNVYYFTVEHDFSKSPPSSSGTSNTTATKSSAYKHCSADCPSLKNIDMTSCSKSACSRIVTDDMDSSDSKCQMPVCPDKSKFPPSPADSDVVINFADINNPCCVKSCDIAEKVKDFIVDGVMSKQKRQSPDVDDPCYCDCVCTFKFSKKTTYCAVCGGYECLGDDMRDQPSYIKPHPCPVYHKLYDKKYIKTPNPWPDEDSKRQTDNASTKSSRAKAAASDRKLASSRSMKSFEKKSDKKDDSKSKQQKPAKEKPEKKKVGKFTANLEEKPEVKAEPRPETRYPYPPVPKNMGWNWNAEDIPGMKPRPNWKPGAANKILVRRYRALREGLDVIAKKKRALAQRKKKTDIKPTIIVTKVDGEYTVQMEVFKKYSKERLLHQNPYEEKPPLVYTIGKTPEEKMKIQKQRERRERRETRRKSRLLQSTFRDRCQEICLKAYNQAIGVLPPPNPNNPECPCQTVPVEQTAPPPVDSCSCSDEGTVSTSDTDNDEWTIEFSPPAAKYDPKAKHPPVLVENESQYTYLDYKVKVLDKQGNQVPRFFKGPDGKQECSDLGGFWGTGHVWNEINKDGYIGPDNRWVPMNFIGPDGMYYSAEEGSFTDANGQLIKIGIDGYVDKDGKWAWYPKRRGGARSTKSLTGSTVDTKNKPSPKSPKPEPPTTKGKGDVKAKVPAKVKGGKEKTAPGDKLNKTVSYASGKAKNTVVMSASMNYDRNKIMRMPPQTERIKIDPRKLAKYKEIMQGLQMYEDFDYMRPLMKTNRACNTLRKKTSVCALHGTNLAPVRSEAGSYNRTSTILSHSGSPLIR